MIEATISCNPFGTTERTSHEVDAAVSPADALEHGNDSFPQPGMDVRDERLHPVKAPGLQRAEKSGSEALVCTVSDVETERFLAPIGCNTDEDRLEDDAVPDPRVALGRVREQVREALGAESAVAKLWDLRICDR
jgi:hypothetical protein